MKRIMIIDTDHNRREQLCTLVDSNTNCTVYVAENGKEALTILNSKPDLVIIDLDMPDGQGYDDAISIREMENRTKILLLSTKTTNLKIGVANLLGTVLEKPIKPKQLISAIKYLIQNAN